MKYAWIDRHRAMYPLALMCALLAVSLNGFRAWLRGGSPDRKRLTDAQLVALIGAIHAEVKGAYGSPRMLEELRGRGFRVGKARVERLMREHEIRARHKRRWKATTDSKHGLPVAPNVVERNFTPEAPNRLWSADLTYLWTDEGWLYLAVVIDLFNREVVGWAIKERMTADIVTDALTMAWFRRRPEPGLIHHSDRGSQYASGVFQALLAEYGMTCSMSRKGNCWDNAPTESFFNSLKNERVHGQALSHARARPELTCSSTSKCFSIGVAVTPRLVSNRRCSSCRTGSRLRTRRNRRHEGYRLEGEKQREPQPPGGVAFAIIRYYCARYLARNRIWTKQVLCMSEVKIPQDVVVLLQEHIHTYEELEIIILLHRQH